MKTLALPASAVVVLLACVVNTASADTNTEETQHYIAGMGTYTFADKKRDWRLNELNLDSDIKEAKGGSVLYGWKFPSNWGVEAQFFSETFETNVGGVTDFYRLGLTADLVYSLGDRTGFTPFVLLGGGGAHNDVSPEKDKFGWVANAGLGFVTGPLFERSELRIRGEARYIFDNFESDYQDIRLGLGVEIPLFGNKNTEIAAPAPETATVVPAPPTGLQDSDGDGVVDGSDKCPDTPAGERVDGAGCPLGKLIALNGVTFEFDSTRLRPDAETILNEASELLKKYPEMQIEVAGHTDSKGEDAYNQKLSEGRASAVRDYFVQKGVTNPVTVRGYGEAEPVADNDTDEGRERNRRVELRIQN